MGVCYDALMPDANETFLSRHHLCHDCDRPILDEASAYTLTFEDTTEVPVCEDCGNRRLGI